MTLHHFLGFQRFLVFLGFGLLESRVEVCCIRLMDQLSFIPGCFHVRYIRFDLADLFALDHNFSLVDSFEEMQKLGVLESGIRIVHHNLEHGLRAVVNVLLFLLFGDFGLFKSLFHG